MEAATGVDVVVSNTTLEDRFAAFKRMAALRAWIEFVYPRFYGNPDGMPAHVANDALNIITHTVEDYFPGWSVPEET